MTTIEEITPGQAGPAAHGGGVTPIDPQELLRHAPARHAWVRTDEGELLARCSWWISDTPPLPEHRVGVIGHYAAARTDAGVQMLEHACARLADAGCTIAVGPMDGNTWRKYRFVTDRGIEPPFFLEPENPVEWPRQFLAYRLSKFGCHDRPVVRRLRFATHWVPHRRCALGAARRLRFHQLVVTQLERLFNGFQIPIGFRAQVRSTKRNRGGPTA